MYRVHRALRSLEHERLHQPLGYPILGERLGRVEVSEIQPSELRVCYKFIHEIKEVLEFPPLPHGGREVYVHVVPGQVHILVSRRHLAHRTKSARIRLENRADFPEVRGELLERS